MVLLACKSVITSRGFFDWLTFAWRKDRRRTLKVPPALATVAKVTDWTAQTYIKVADGLTDVAGWIARALVLILIPIGFLNVFLRYVGQYVQAQLVNNTWIEAQWYLYGLIFLLMFPYLLRYDGNVRVDFWYAERSDRVKARIDLIGHLVGLVPFTLLAIWASWKPVREAWVHWEMSPDPGGLTPCADQGDDPAGVHTPGNAGAGLPDTAGGILHGAGRGAVHRTRSPDENRMMGASPAGTERTG